MTIQEITRTLERVAENQAKHADLHVGHAERSALMEKRQAEHLANMAKLEEAHARHTADIAEIDKQIALIVESQNRHDRQLGLIFETLGDLTDKHLENEARFAELAEANKRAGERIEKLEGSYELLESFVKSVREETRDYFVETDKKLAMLADVHARTAELVAEFVKETNESFRETNGRFTETDKRLAEFVGETNRRFSVLERNGSTTKPRAKVKKARKAPKKKGAK